MRRSRPLAISIAPGQPYDPELFVEWLVQCTNGRTEQLLEWVRAMEKTDIVQRLETKLRK